MAGIPYTFFYQNEYLNDTQHLTREQHGSYLLLLMAYWNSGKPLNNKNGRLSVIAKMTKEEWAVEEEIYAEFFDIDGDIWTHGRCEFDLDRVRKKSSQAAYAGRKSSESKKSIKEEPLKITPEPLQSEESGTPVEREINGSSTDVEQESNVSPTMYVSMDVVMNEKEFVRISFERFWEIYPRKDKKKEAEKAFEKALKKADIETILEGVNRYVKFLKTTTQQKAMPGSWLNGERWNDELEPVKPSQPAYIVTEPTRVPDAFDPNEFAPRGGSLSESLKSIALGRAV